VAAGSREVPGGNDRVTSVISLASEQQDGAGVTAFQELDSRARHRQTGSLHEFFAGRSSRNRALVELPDLLGRDRFHRRPV
jgi:hypothetical protein